MSCTATIPARVTHRRPSPGRRREAPSIVRATLRLNGATGLERGPLVAVTLDSPSRIVVDSHSRVWCRCYRGLGGAFRKDRGPSKELGRALCDEVKALFGCEGFLTTDELPRYGISRASRRAILAAAGASRDDCVVVYAYPLDLATRIDDHLHGRLRTML